MIVTNYFRQISTVGGRLKGFQNLSGHLSLQTAQRYIDLNQETKMGSSISSNE